MTTESVRPVCASCRDQSAKVARDYKRDDPDRVCCMGRNENIARAIEALPVRPVDGGEREALAKLLHEGPRTDMMETARELADKLLAAGYRRIDAGEVVVPSGLVAAAQDISNFAWSALRADCTESGEEIMRRLTRLRTELTLTAAAKGVGG